MQPKPNPKQATATTRPATHLCHDCLHGEHCQLRRMPLSPVHQCLEYDHGTVPVEAIRLTAVPAPGRSARENAPPIPGLCGNCDHRQGCVLPRPTGGVWHCEEYR